MTMIWLGIIILLVLLFLSYVLFTPVRLEVNTPENIYKFSIYGLGYVMLLPNENLFNIRFRILFYRNEIDPFQRQPKPSKSKERTELKRPEKKRKKKRLSRKRMKWLMRKMVRIPFTFRINRLDLELDTDDYIKNAYLYPLFCSINSGPVNLSINYENRISLILEIENRVYRIVRVFVT